MGKGNMQQKVAGWIRTHGLRVLPSGLTTPLFVVFLIVFGLKCSSVAQMRSYCDTHSNRTHIVDFVAFIGFYDT